MFQLNLPSFKTNIIKQDNKYLIYDFVRNKYVTITPEEWVRQHFIHYLVECKHYPKNLLNNEVEINLNGTRKRCDTVLYKRNLTAKMIIEYKAPHINIAQNVFDQIVRYNIILKVEYLIVSNGYNHYCCKIDYKNQKYNFLPEIPDYADL